MPERSLQWLDEAMVRLADGDRSAFDGVFNMLWPRVLGFCTKALAGHSDAEDVAQHSLLKIFERASDYDGTRPAIAWALAIAGWECRTALQKRRRRKEVGDLPLAQLPAGDESPESASIARELRHAMDVALADLPASDREPLIRALSDEGFGGAASSAVRKRKQRALERLRLVWRRLYGQG